MVAGLVFREHGLVFYGLMCMVPGLVLRAYRLGCRASGFGYAA